MEFRAELGDLERCIQCVGIWNVGLLRSYLRAGLGKGLLQKKPALQSGGWMECSWTRRRLRSSAAALLNLVNAAFQALGCQFLWMLSWVGSFDFDCNPELSYSIGWSAFRYCNGIDFITTPRSVQLLKNLHLMNVLLVECSLPEWLEYHQMLSTEGTNLRY